MLSNQQYEKLDLRDWVVTSAFIHWSICLYSQCSHLRDYHSA